MEEIEKIISESEKLSKQIDINGRVKIATIIDNAHNTRKVFTGLQKGDKLKAKCSVYSTEDIGMSGETYRYEAFEKGKIYKVSQTYLWGFTQVAYVSDEDSTLHMATPDIFEVIENNL